MSCQALIWGLLDQDKGGTAVSSTTTKTPRNSATAGQKELRLAAFLWESFQFSFKCYQFVQGSDERTTAACRELSAVIEAFPACAWSR